jgi:uncharacterized integral membrane protein (TIGR00698 family)
MLELLERRLFAHAWLETLVLAIAVGAAVRTVWTPGPCWRPGVDFSAKLLLEIAVVLLGASVSAASVAAAGPLLLVGVAATVAAALVISYGAGRVLGLSQRMAILVACGNSICGNSAIAAVAPVIGADGEDVAASIAFTAVLGVAVVIGLPLLGHAMHMSGLRYGAFAGLTVYAVPQVLAATAPLGPAAVRFGTLIKLVRVLMLGPVCFVLSMLARRLGTEASPSRPGPSPKQVPCAAHASGFQRFVPWFILGFLAMMAVRSLNIIPVAAMPAIAGTATVLTVLSMAALGLGTDVRAIARAGGRVIAAVTLSLIALGLTSLALIQLLRVA